MQREILRFSAGEPVTFKLNGRAPSQKEGRDGMQWQYIVNDDSAITWLPLDAHQAIQRLEARNGDLISLTKPRGQHGQWIARRVDEAAPGQQQQPAASPQSTPAPAAAALARPAAEMIAGYLYCAIDACAAAEKYAREKHEWQLEFGPEDVRAIANSLFINEAKSASAQGGR